MNDLRKKMHFCRTIPTCPLIIRAFFLQFTYIVKNRQILLRSEQYLLAFIKPLKNGLKGRGRSYYVIFDHFLSKYAKE